MRDIVGYYYDAAVYHPECFPEDVDPDGEEVAVICNWEDDACTSICDVCLQPLLECDCSSEA